MNRDISRDKEILGTQKDGISVMYDYVGVMLFRDVEVPWKATEEKDKSSCVCIVKKRLELMRGQLRQVFRSFQNDLSVLGFLHTEKF